MNLKHMMLIVLFFVSSSVLASPDKDFINAIQRGANAELTIRVVDDAKQPVGDAKVRVRFDSAFKASGEVKSLVTDTNGIGRGEISCHRYQWISTCYWAYRKIGHASCHKEWLLRFSRRN